MMVRHITSTYLRAAFFRDTVYIAYNFSHFAIYLPKLIKIHVNLTKFWQKQKCSFFIHGVCFVILEVFVYNMCINHRMAMEPTKIYLRLQLLRLWRSQSIFRHSQGNVRETSGKSQGNVRETSGKRQGNVREKSGKRQGNVRETSGKSQGNVREKSGKRQGISFLK